MKNKYERLSKAEKKIAYEDFKKESDKNRKYSHVLNRMLIFGIIGFIYGVVSIICDLFVFNAAVWAYLVDAVVIIFTFYLLFQRHSIKTAVLNNFLIEREKKLREAEEAKKKAEEEAKKPKKRKHVSKNAKVKKTEKKTTRKSAKKE